MASNKQYFPQHKLEMHSNHENCANKLRSKNSVILSKLAVKLEVAPKKYLY